MRTSFHVAAVFLACAGCSAWGERPPGEGDPGVAPGRDERAPRDIVALDEARQIAEGFIAYQSEEHFRAWRGAQIDAMTPFYDLDGHVAAFEAAVRSPEAEERGFIMVEAARGRVPVSAFAAEGPSNARALASLYRDLHGASPEGDGFRLLWRGPGTAALETPDEPRILSGSPEADGAYDDGDARAARATPDDARVDALRQAYIDRDFSSSSFSGKSQRISRAGARGAQIGDGDAEFANFHQEIRRWTSSTSIDTCYAGCTPVAFLIVMEFWDRHGYPGLVGTTADNANTDTDDPDVIEAINGLRWAMRTQCLAYGQKAATSPRYFSSAVAYMNRRSAYAWSSDTLGSDAWDESFRRLREQIDRGSPAVLHYNPHYSTNGIRNPSHSGAAWGYEDAGGELNDYIYVKTGQLSPLSQAVNRAAIGDYLVTRVVRP